MKSTDARKVQVQTSNYKEIITIKKHEKVVGFYIPIQDSNQDEIQQAFNKLSATVNTALAESGLSEDELSKVLDLSNPME